ncbi:MAG: metallophosphoesterase [Clostridia bacterium]|nr:metallophosphoesterase [Clostridia bacterium]
MDKILLHEYRIPVKGVKRKTIYHFSDTHLAEYDSLSPEKEIEAAKKATDAWIRVRKAFADGHGEPFGEAQMLPAREHFVNLMNASRDGDVLVIAGDMLDFVNGANVRLAEKELKDYPCPVLALCGNHENANNIPEGMTISMMREPIQIAELDDLIVLGLDDSKREITEKQYSALEEALASGKAVVVAMHIPIMTEENQPVLRGAGEYFRLNYNDCPEMNLRFIELIKANPDKIAAVLCGHLHFANDSHITDGIMQYVSTQGVTGNLNKYIIGE